MKRTPAIDKANAKVQARMWSHGVGRYFCGRQSDMVGLGTRIVVDVPLLPPPATADGGQRDLPPPAKPPGGSGAPAAPGPPAHRSWA
jgi:hypothetical protein